MSEESKVTQHHHDSNQPPTLEHEIATVVHHKHESSQQQQQQQQQQEAATATVMPHYGTFQGIPSSPTPTIGFPQPAPPPGAINPPHDYYTRPYQPVPGYVVADGTPVNAHHRLPCCGIGFGWILFVMGFFLGGLPWYVAAIILLCCKNVDPREKAAYVCCTIAAALAIIATIFGATRLGD